MEAPRPLSGSRRHRGARHLARGLCLGALSLVLLAAAPAGAAAETGVVFDLPNGESREIPGAELTREKTEPVAPPESCVVRGRVGEASEPTQHQGLPVGQALERVGVGEFGFLTIARPNGTVAYLPAEWFGGSAFEGCRYARFSVESGVTKFFRPPLGPDDLNAEDNIVGGGGQPLVVGVHRGRVVEVEVTASTGSTSAGTPVRFTATVPGGGEFAFAWTFGDGSTATGPSVERSFSGVGTYLVRATASAIGGDESGGESAPFEIVIGNPPTTDAPGATTSPQPTNATPTSAPGKGREGPGGNGTEPAPAGERAKPKSKKPKDRSPVQRGASPADRSTSQPNEASSPPTSSPPTVPVTPLTQEAPSEGSPQPSRSRTTPPAPGEELVEGRLVGDDLGPTSIAAATAAAGEAEGSSSAAGALGGGSGAPAVALIVVALLAGGALFEWRRSSPTH